MEPPAKKLRMSPRDGPEVRANRANLDMDQARLEPGILYPTKKFPTPVRSEPSRSIALPTYWRRNLQRRGVPPNQDAAIHLRPRVPDVTVTANVINIGILDGSSEVSATQIPAPTAQTEIAISKIGTLTVPGIALITGAPGSESSGASPGNSLSGSATDSLSGSLFSTMSVNSTSASDRTVTVTATSTLLVPLRNSTANMTSSHYKSIFTAEGFTTTIDDSTTTDEPTGYRFGDITPSFTTVPTLTEGVAPTNARTSSTEVTPTQTPPPGTIVLTPQQQQMVGGLVGGVAGVALVLLGILYFLKWYRQKLKAQGRLPEQMMMRHRQLPSGDGHDLIPRDVTVDPSRSSVVPIAALKRSLSKMRPHSSYTFNSNNTDYSSVTPPSSDRTFQRVSGRKIPSVLLTGGDGYDNQGPGSPSSEYSSYARSREVSQVSSYRESQNPINPFLDPIADDHGFSPVPVIGAGNTPWNFSRSQLSIQTGGISAFNPNRQSDGTIMIRPSPARTPTTSSPTSSSLRLPMHSPPLMSGDIPEMPPLNPFGYQASPRKFSEDSLGAPRSIMQRSVSGISARTSSSVGGKFREEI